MSKRRIAFFFVLILSLFMLFYGVLVEQFMETGINGSILCLSCIGIL